MSGPRILVIDDEPQLRRALRRMLEGNGYDVQEAADAAKGLTEVEAFKPDVILLDLMLPDMDGVEVCRRIRESRLTPIIILSVLGDEPSKVRALDEGADDYLTKPFGSKELLARVRVSLRRAASNRPQASRLEVGDLAVDFERRSVALGAEPVHLTPTEYSLLKYLATNSDRVLTHPMILRAVWGQEYADDSHLLRTFINQLRAKLGDDSAKPRYIQTEPAIGYRFLGPDAVGDLESKPNSLTKS
jgi:two-component system, OmpR family, KDP operon response regulator KdpE